MAKMSRGSIRLLWIVSAAALVLSACSKSSTPSYGGGSSPTAAQGGSVTIGTSSVPGVGTALVDAKGFTLYDLASEANGQGVAGFHVVTPSGSSSSGGGGGYGK
jgi:hypothetical protein